MFKFGAKSLNKLASCETDLQLIALESIKASTVDFGINEGHRTVERQKELFDKGWSRIDGISKKGKHNYFPSKAFDVKIYVIGRPELTYDKIHLAYVGGVILTVAQRLYDEGLISHELRWGGNWDGDSELLYDQNLQDLPHFELKKK